MTKQPGEDPDGQEKSSSAGNPFRAIRRETTSGDHTMQVGMMKQVRAPSMEHGKKADLGTQMFWISGDGAQGLCRGPKQNAIEFSLILIGDGGNLFGHGKDHVEVFGVQKLGLAILEPLSPSKGLAFWTVSIPAGNGELSITCVMGSLF